MSYVLCLMTSSTSFFYSAPRVMRPNFCRVWYHWRAGQYGRAQGQVVGGGGDARTEQLRSQYTAGKRVRWCEIQTKWRSSVVGERFCEAILASPHP